MIRLPFRPPRSSGPRRASPEQIASSILHLLGRSIAKALRMNWFYALLRDPEKPATLAMTIVTIGLRPLLRLRVNMARPLADRNREWTAHTARRQGDLDRSPGARDGI